MVMVSIQAGHMASLPELEERSMALERRLAEVTKERDALERDVEALCMQNGEFSGSEVLALRIRSLEAELSKLRARHGEVAAERDGLRDDLAHHRGARKDVEDSLKREIDTNAGLERDLGYYMQQSGAAIAERDKALMDAEGSARAEGEARLEASRLREEVAGWTMKAEDAVKRAEVAERRCCALEVEVEEGRKLAGVRESLVEITKERDTLEASRSELVLQRDSAIQSLASFRLECDARDEDHAQLVLSLQSDLSEARAATELAAKALETEQDSCRGLGAELEEISARNRRLEASLDNRAQSLTVLDRALVAMADAFVEEFELLERPAEGVNSREAAEAAASGSGNLGIDVDRLTPAQGDPLEGACKDLGGPACVAALRAVLQQALRTRAQERGEITLYKHMSMSLKQKLAQATAEKVQAMLEAADLQRERELLRPEKTREKQKPRRKLGLLRGRKS